MNALESPSLAAPPQPPRRGGPRRRRSLFPILIVLAGLAGLAGPAPSGAAPVADTDINPHDKIAEWRDMNGASRIVTGPDGLIHVLTPSHVRHVQPDGTLVSQTPVSGGMRELTIDGAGTIYGAREKEVIRVERGIGNLRWKKELFGDIHGLLGERPPYLAALSWDPVGDRVVLIYDKWSNNVQWTFLAEFADDGLQKEGHALDHPAHSYWDIAHVGEVSYLLNRANSSVESYRLGRYEGITPLPAAAERIAPGPGGTIYFLSERRWVYQVAADGTLLDVWDATDPTPGAGSRVTDLVVDEVGRVYVADPGMGRVRVYAPTAGGRPHEPPGPLLDCRTVPDKFASPTYLRLGEKTKVTLRLDGDCPAFYEKADIMLVVDHSNSMEGEKIVALQEAVRTFVSLMDLQRDQVGMVGFQSFSRLLVPLSQDRQRLMDAIDGLDPVGGTDIAAAIDLAIPEVIGPNHRPDAKPIIILMTDGVPFNNTRLRTLAAGDRARYAGITSYTIGFGADVDPDLLRIVARVPELYYFAPDGEELRKAYEAIARRIAASVLLKSVTIVDEVPRNMAYQDGSAVPPADWDPVKRTLTWRFAPVPFTGVEMHYWLEPLEVGEWPTNVKADYDGIDGLDQPQRDIFPVPRVIVVSPDRPTPTPTTPPSPTPTPTVTLTPTLPPSPTIPPPTVTPRPRPKPIYVPIVFNDRCFTRHTDVVLVIDASTTMRRVMPDGRLKLEAAKDAARAFLAQLQLEPDAQRGYDQAAIVWYNDTARTEQGLTRDRAALAAAIDRVSPPIEGTRIDLGLKQGHQVLFASPNRRMDNLPAIVLLSDGEPNRVSLEQVYAAADKIKRDRIALYAVGYGDDVREEALRAIAGRDDRYVFAPDALALTRIYRQIAGQLICR